MSAALPAYFPLVPKECKPPSQLFFDCLTTHSHYEPGMVRAAAGAMGERSCTKLYGALPRRPFLACGCSRAGPRRRSRGAGAVRRAAARLRGLRRKAPDRTTAAAAAAARELHAAGGEIDLSSNPPVCVVSLQLAAYLSATTLCLPPTGEAASLIRHTRLPVGGSRLSVHTRPRSIRPRGLVGAADT
jgi:hypothetical protein